MVSKMKTEFNLKSEFILSFGVLSPRKNLELLIRTFYEASSNAPDWRLVIAGGEPKYYSGYRNKLEEVAKSQGIQDRVIFTGYLDWDTANELYSKADIFAHTPNKRIAASGPISTAINHHLPILVSDIPVFQEKFDHRENGYLVPPRLEPASEGLLELMDDRTLRESLRRGTYALADKYSWENIAQVTLKEYRSLLDEK